MEPKKCVIKMLWCDESLSWCADSDDVPGLVLGAKTFEELVARVREIAPEMLEDNLNYKGAIEFHFETERVEYLEAAS